MGESAQTALESFQEAEDDSSIVEALELLRNLGVYGSNAPMVPEMMAAPTALQPTSAGVAVSGAALATQRRLTTEVVRAKVMEAVSQVVSESNVSSETPLMDAGLDSLNSVSLRNDLSQMFEVTLPATLTFDFPTPNEITDYV